MESIIPSSSSSPPTPPEDVPFKPRLLRTLPNQNLLDSLGGTGENPPPLIRKSHFYKKKETKVEESFVDDEKISPNVDQQDIAVTKVFQQTYGVSSSPKVLSKPFIREDKDKEIRRALTEILDEKQLEEILTHQRDLIKDQNYYFTIYDYLNGLKDIRGYPCAVEIPFESYKSYFEKLLSLPLRDYCADVCIQIKGGSSLISNDPNRILFPLDIFLSIRKI